VNSMVAFARENGYVAVAWPEGGQVAQLYGGDMGVMINSATLNLTTLSFKGGKPSMALADAMTPEDILNIQRHASTGQYVTYNSDYLHEIMQEGGANAEVAKRVIGYLDAYTKNPDEDALKESIREDDNVSIASNNRLAIKFPAEQLYNARIHKLLYNTMLPSAAKDIARDSKAAKKAARTMTPAEKDAAYKEGRLSTGFIFVEDAWNEKMRGRRPADGGGARSSSAETDENTESVSDLLRGGSSNYRLGRETQMFGVYGHKARLHMKAMWIGDMTRTSRLMSEHYSERMRSTHNGMTGSDHFNDTEWSREPVDLEDVATYWAQDADNDAPWNGILEINDTEGLIDSSLRIPYQISGGHGYSFDNYISNGGEVPVALLYRYAHDVMSKVWKIENPNPFVLPYPLIKKLYAAYVSGIEGNDEFQEAQDDNAREFENGGRHGEDTEPEDFDLTDWRTDVEATDGEPTMDIFLDGDAGLMEWVKEFAVVKNKMDAYLIKSIMMPNVDQDVIAKINELEREGLEDVAPDMQERLPTPYRAGTETEAGAESEYGAENPEFAEQKWHSLYLNERIKGKKIKVPYSLRSPRGNDQELDIINSKITKPQSDWTVLDRVSYWLSGLRDRMATGDVIWSMKQGMLDEGASVERWEREVFGDVLDAADSPYKMLNMTRNLPSVMAAISKAGIPELRDGAFQPVDGRKGFVEILRPLYEHPDGDLVELWQGYAAARRSSQLLEERNEDGTMREKLFSRSEVNRLLALGEKYPVFKNVFDDWQEFNNQLLTLAVDRGVLTAAQRDAWSENDYVPFYRAMEEIEGVDQRTGYGKIKQGVEGQHHGIKRLRGSENPLGNIIENMWFNTASLIDKVYKNEAMTRITDMLEGIAMKKIRMPFEAVRVTNGQLANALGRAGLLAGSPATIAAHRANQQLVQSGDETTNAGWLKAVEEMTSQQKMQWSLVFRMVKPTAPNVVSLMRNGKLEYYEIEDENLLRTLHGMQAEGLVGLMKAMGMSKGLLTKMITVDPAFMLANWMRDTLSAWVTSDANFVPVAGSIAAMPDIWKEQGDFIKMMMAGAGGGGFYDLTGGSVSKALHDELTHGTKSWLPKLWRGYMKFGAMSENSNRIAIAKRVVAQGGSVAEGMHQAQDIMNFTMSGDYAAMKFLIRSVPFMNARLQGLYRLYRGGRDNPVGFLLKGLSISAATLALLAKNDGDDDYERLPEYQKDLSWNFFIDGMRYAIPKPFEVGLIFGTLPERFVRGMTGADDFSVSKQRFYAALSETLAFNPVPQLFKPMYELGANRNTFTDKPIVNMA